MNVGGSTGLAYFRPKSPGYEAKDITVEDCTFIGSQDADCFRGSRWRRGAAQHDLSPRSLGLPDSPGNPGTRVCART